ncbi:MAG: LpxL/LpxP family Kdo(2)-lipid IV(A) lauroyl/palmitoleoyl acyltransferase [Gammaproteobacteria bacterium]|nr:LpxL/LpxP family Kdo(2)-lipid IV(A) lauroyl/palmitoleoyl acyltransferase [Gammaproteobacteria bacterium]
MKSSQLPPFKFTAYLHPKYLLTWTGLGLMRLAAFLPYSMIVGLGVYIGWMSFHLMPGRRRITRTNIRLCFPDLDEQQQRKLIKQNFYDASIGMLESPLAWWGSDRRLMALHKIEGLENIKKAQQDGKGILLLGAHYSSLEMGARLLAYHMDEQPTYKRAHNKLYNDMMTRSRIRVHGGAIPSADLREIIKQLKQGNIIWYAPDQDFGRNSSVFAPFMGVQTSTLTTTARLAKVSGAHVLPMYSERLPGCEGYLVRIGEALENFPSQDEVADATRANQVIEAQLERTPSQYLWGHRRFKTRPYGDPLLYAPRMDSALRKYKMLMPLLTIPAVLATVWMAIKNRDSQYFTQRLGFALPKQQKGGLWLHAASVGEVNAVMPLIEKIHLDKPGLPITLTTATPTGGRNARNKLPEGCIQHFLPIDWNWASLRLMKHLQPSCLLIMETEIWPNLYWNFYRNNLPLVIINGRLSERTINNRFYWVRRLYLFTSQIVRTVLARSKIDAERFIQMGANPDLVKIVGNMKFAMPDNSAQKPDDLKRPYILAASTRDDEEWRIVQAWQKSLASNTLLVIVPRHPHRLESILQQLSPLVDHTAIRSRNETVNDTTQVYIADTFGELNQFIAGSEFVIMGGSFVPLGGQNILEVAQQSKAVLFGPNMENFSDEARLFVEHNAGIQCRDESELSTQIDRLFNNKEQSLEIGKNGAQLLAQYGDIVECYIGELKEICPSFNDS